MHDDAEAPLSLFRQARFDSLLSTGERGKLALLQSTRARVRLWHKVRMPEIAEGTQQIKGSRNSIADCIQIPTPVARIVHFLRLHLVGKKIQTASAIDDANVFGKVGTSGAAVEAALKGKRVSFPLDSPWKSCCYVSRHRDGKLT